MKSAPLAMLLLFGLLCTALADPAISKVQQTLKDQGFYYGEANGQLDVDTTAAIRRYQIRNGLKVSGELDAETRKALGVSGPVAAKPKPTPQPTTTPDADADDERRNAPPGNRAETPAPRASEEVAPYPGYAPGPRGLQPAISGALDGTPYEVAPPDVQRRVITGAQSLLARRGYYGDVIDGAFGPATEFAVRTFQNRAGLRPTGRLDMETLSALGLLPGEGRPRFRRPRMRLMRPPVEIAPNGEPIYRPD